MFGVQSNLPSFMESAHKLNDKSNVEAYLSRLSKFDDKFTQVLDNLKIREEKGIIPPQFVIDRVLNEMKGFVGEQSNEINTEIDTPDPVKKNILYDNLSKKIAETKPFPSIFLNMLIDEYIATADAA